MTSIPKTYLCLFYLFNKQVGRAPAGSQQISSVTDIHPSFGNRGRLGYHRRRMLVDGGSIPDKKGSGGGDKFILDLLEWVKCVKISTRFVMDSAASKLTQGFHFFASFGQARFENNLKCLFFNKHAPHLSDRLDGSTAAVKGYGRQIL